MSFFRFIPVLAIALLTLSACNSLPQGEAKFPTGARDQGDFALQSAHA